MTTKTIAIVGGGRLGGVLVRRLLACGYQCTLIERCESNLNRFASHPKLSKTLDVQAGLAHADIVFLCLKPGLIVSWLQRYSALFSASQFIVSMAAGLSLGLMLPYVPTGLLLRVMPNVAIEIGQGMLACCAARPLPQDQHDGVTGVLSDLGRLEWILESEFALFTAVVGSGPAFYAAMIQSLAQQISCDYALPQDRAERWLQFLGEGTFALLNERSFSFTELIELVKAPNGTTEAGLSVQQESMPFDWPKAIKSAYNRALELDKQ